ncbi:hypothetical protein [Elioraea sp.]|uniref:hypothetical protein n=1 Tax=Elioraea sp. TaxID=2185103 RepID=UPI0025C2D09E|nr:hypothetical protein [Elioraea sp.]
MPPAPLPATPGDQPPPGLPPSPPMLNRIAGAILLAATLGLASVLGFVAAIWGVVSPLVRMVQGGFS